MLVEFILGGTVFLLFAWMVFRKPSGLPPGRWGLPLLGYVPLDGKYFTDQLQDLHKQYGDVYIWKFGAMLQVYVHDYSICRQMFSSPDFIDRPNLESLQDDKGDALGIVGSNGGIWHTNRRFSLRQLRDLGMGKSSMVSAVHEQALRLLESIKETAGKEGIITPAVNTSVVNIIWKMIADKQYDIDDPINEHLRQLIIQTNESFSYATFADMFWFLKYIIPPSIFRRYFKLDVLKEAEDKFFKYCDGLIEEHQENLEPDNPKDLMDAYLIEMNEKKTDGDGIRNADDLKFLLFDMFFAGSETTTSTMDWTFLYMAAFPDKQRKLQEEIDQVLPKGILATLQDRPSMPYTEAVINEVLRKSSLTNFGVHHAAVKDTTLAGYKIPKGTMIASAAASIHHDGRYWDKPDCFLPERWINPEGKFVMKKEGYLPFGTGKRVCVGESLARMEIFVFTTSVFQNFSVAPPEGKQINLLPDYNNLFGHFPRKQNIIFTLRD